MRRALIVIGKAPTPGQAKTRLVPPLTPEGAAGLYGAFLADTVELAARLDWEQTTLVHPRGHGPHLRAFGVSLLEQPAHGLGDALKYAFTSHFERAFDMVILIGSDNPTLSVGPILAAEGTLQAADDLAIGPTTDGGYYLIGMCRPHLAVFEGIDWSTPRVYAQTVERAREVGLHVHAVEHWHDVDEPSDLERLREDLAHLPASVAPHTRAALSSLLRPVPEDAAVARKRAA